MNFYLVLSIASILYLYKVFYVIAPRHRDTNLQPIYKLAVLTPITLFCYGILLMLEPSKDSKNSIASWSNSDQ